MSVVLAKDGFGKGQEGLVVIFSAECTKNIVMVLKVSLLLL